MNGRHYPPMFSQHHYTPSGYQRHYPGSWDDSPAAHTPPTMGYLTDNTTPKEHAMTNPTEAALIDAERAKSRAAFLSQSPTTTPSFPDDRPTGAVPSLRPNPGMLRALLQPIVFFTLTEPVDAYEAGDTVAMQFWGEGRVMLTPLPAEAARGRIPTTFPANKLHGYIAVPRQHLPLSGPDEDAL